MRQEAKVKVFSNKPEEDKFYQSEHKQGYNISCSVEGYQINRTSASIYFRPCISFDTCQVQKRIGYRRYRNVIPVVFRRKQILATNWT